MVVASQNRSKEDVEDDEPSCWWCGDLVGEGMTSNVNSSYGLGRREKKIGERKKKSFIGCCCSKSCWQRNTSVYGNIAREDSDNDLASDLYARRGMWATANICDKFFGGFQTTSRQVHTEQISAFGNMVLLSLLHSLERSALHEKYS
ncbi:hypothetical protein PIB30_036581 [Stylosanthes scabra]|uniref:Uncharacterized protein n=1 Tax=Stylosanthes scabra TaxID=79078 RepID=A0ABU6YAS3_9FABA|nr:hypothetical protein [Stylosanthes scabra]